MMSCSSVTGHKDCYWSHSNVLFWCHKCHFKIIVFFLYASVWSIKWTVYDFHVRSTRDVCSYWIHILTNCVFLTVFPTMVDPFELSFSSSHTFPVFSAIEVLLYWTFRACEKDFLFFSWNILEPVGGHVLVVGSVTWVHKTHKLGAPKTQYNDLVFYSCRLHLQLTNMSDNLDFLKFHLLLQYGPYMTPSWP